MKKVIEQVRTIWRKVPKALRSAWITAWVTFVGAMLSIITGLLPVLANAVSTKDFQPFFDSLIVGWTAALSAALGFVAGLVNGIWRALVPIDKAYQTLHDTDQTPLED